MPAKLLILTFHAGGALLEEDLRFKSSAIESGLVSGDAMDPGAVPQSLKEQAGNPMSGLKVVKSSADDTHLVTLNRVSANAWRRDPFRKPDPKRSEFARWLEPIVSTPIDCLVLAGHHGAGIVWGSERQAPPSDPTGHYPYTALVPDVVKVDGVHKAVLSVRGFVDSMRVFQTAAGPFDVTPALKTCRLLFVLGCNVATRAAANRYQDWVAVAAGKRPLILGWYKKHSMPRDAAGEHFSAGLWRGLRKLADDVGSPDLPTLCDTHALQVAETWVAALKGAYAGSAHCQEHLWWTPGPSKKCRKRHGPRGAAAVLPDTSIYHVIDGALKKVPG